MVTRSEFTIWGQTWIIEADWSVASSQIMVNGEPFGIDGPIGCPSRPQTVGDYKHKKESFKDDFLRECIDIDPGYGDGYCCPNCECDDLATDEDGEEIKGEWDCGGDDWGNGCINACAYTWRNLPPEREVLERAGQLTLALYP